MRSVPAIEPNRVPVMNRFMGILLALVLTLGFSSAALAHAALVVSVPAQNAVLAAAPEAFELRFNEPVSPLLLNLVAPDGAIVPLTGAVEADGALRVPAPSGLGNGTFILSYRVISVDGHPIGGSVSFSIGAAGGQAGVAVDGIDWPVLVPIWAAKVLLYAGLFFGVGGSFFRRFLAAGTDVGRRTGTVVLALGLVAAPLSLALQGLDALDRPLGDLLHSEVWRAALSTTLGAAMGIAMLAMLLALIGERMRGAVGGVVVLLALAGVGLSLAATGHASSAAPQWLTRPAIALHGIAVAFWAGALPPLWVLLKTGAPEATAALRRFSRAIPVVLGVLIIAGVTLALVQLGGPSALLQTAYGRVLLAKLALVAMLLGLAAINRWRLAGRADDAAARRRLVRIIAAETVLVLAVFAVVSLWRFTPPPRTLVPAAPITLSLSAGELMADITLAADGAAEIMVMDGAEMLAAQGLTLRLSNPGAGIEAMSYPGEAVADGVWAVKNLLIPVSGEWLVQLEVRVSDFDLQRLSASFALSARH